METVDPELAGRLNNFDWPANIKFIPALDGTRTAFASELSRSGWLSGSGAPKVRETVLCEQFFNETSNVIFPGFGQGVGLKELLSRFKPWQAVFVWEADLRLIAIPLALHDFSKEIIDQRLVFLTEPDLEKALVDFLIAHPAFAVPTKMMGWPWLAENRLTELSQLVERAIAEINSRVGEKIVELQNQLNAVYALSDRMKDQRVEIVSLLGLSQWDRLAEELEEAAGKLAWRSAVYRLDRPGQSGTVALLERLLEEKPNTLISLGLNQSQWPFKVPPEIRFFSFLSLPGMAINEKARNKLSSPEPNERFIVGSSEDYEVLTNRFGPENVVPAEMVVNSETFSPQQIDAEFQIGFFADCPSPDPEKAGIRQQSHQTLWREVRRLIAARPLFFTNTRTAEFIEEASKRCGVKLTDPELIRYFSLLIENNLAPAVVVTTLAERLIAAGLKTRIFGSGWEAVPKLAAMVEAFPANPKELNAAFQRCEFLFCPSNTSNWRQLVFAGLCAGRIVVVKKLPNDKLADSVDLKKAVVFLEPGVDFINQIRHAYLNKAALRQQTFEARRYLTDHFGSTNLLEKLLGR
jgi:hypothetical protein